MRALELVGFEQLSKGDQFAADVGHLDADGGLAGDALDQDGFGVEAEAEVFAEVDDAGVLDAGFGLELEGSDDGAGVDLDDVAEDVELFELGLDAAGGVLELLLVVGIAGGGLVEQVGGREAEDRVDAVRQGASAVLGGQQGGKEVGHGLEFFHLTDGDLLGFFFDGVVSAGSRRGFFHARVFGGLMLFAGLPWRASIDVGGEGGDSLRAGSRYFWLSFEARFRRYGVDGEAAGGGPLFGFFDGALVGALAPGVPCVGSGFEPRDGTGQPDGEDGEGECRYQVDRDHDGGEGDYQRADEVERIDEVIGEGQTERAADADGAREEAQGSEGESRAERQGEENRAEDLDAAGLQFLAANPFQERRKVSRGKKAVAPNIWKKRSER